LNKDFKEAIILTSTNGTGYKETAWQTPFCLTQIAGRPFLYYVINHLRKQGIEKIIFCLDNEHQVIPDWLENEFAFLDFDYVIENPSLDSFDQLHAALQKTNDNNVFVANAHRLVSFDKNKLIERHVKNQSTCSFVLKSVIDNDKEEPAVFEKHPTTDFFGEKSKRGKTRYQTGIFLINKKQFLQNKYPNDFSFENEYFQKLNIDEAKEAIDDEGYFLDIENPEDLIRAEIELKTASFSLTDIDAHWTLFLDRDGVINEDKPGSYITTPEEFIFTKGSPVLFKKLTQRFRHIIIVTNQRGVGRGIIKQEDLMAMNEKMLAEINRTGGKVDKIYFCTDTENQSFHRKPNPGMALQAKQDFPDIDFHRTLIVGNSISDMQFGRFAGMRTVFVSTTNKNITLPHPDIDLLFDGLESFAHQL